MWIPAHARLKGNEAADKLAKQAVLDTSIEMEVSNSRYKIITMIKRTIMKRWQTTVGNWKQMKMCIKYSHKWGKGGIQVGTEERKTYYLK